MNIVNKTKEDLGVKTEISIKKKQKVEYKKIASSKKQAGHTLFSFNTRTGCLKIAEYKKSKDINWNDARIAIKSGTFNMDVIVEKDCIYFQALNIKNAIKKIVKTGFPKQHIYIKS